MKINVIAVFVIRHLQLSYWRLASKEIIQNRFTFFFQFYEHLCLWYLPDEDEFRLRPFHDEDHTGTARSKQTARGQPAPPVPQEDSSPPTTPKTQTQPKAQVRGRPPPPPEEDEENPPPLPRPRNKQQRKRHEEPYRPMEWDACVFTERR